MPSSAGRSGYGNFDIVYGFRTISDVSLGLRPLISRTRRAMHASLCRCFFDLDRCLRSDGTTHCMPMHAGVRGVRLLPVPQRRQHFGPFRVQFLGAMLPHTRRMMCSACCPSARAHRLLIAVLVIRMFFAFFVPGSCVSRTDAFDGWDKLFLGHWWKQQVDVASAHPGSGLTDHLNVNASARVVIEPTGRRRRYVTKYSYSCR